MQDINSDSIVIYEIRLKEVKKESCPNFTVKQKNGHPFFICCQIMLHEFLSPTVRINYMSH